MRVGPRRVEVEVQPCADCGEPVYASPTAGLRGLRHVGPILGQIACSK